MEQYYKITEKLLKDGAFYVCSCHPDTFKKLKVDMKDCPCRGLDGKENMARWKEMLGGREGFAVRMKTGMDDPNPAMRDPPMLRVDNTPHALTGKKFHVWPLYNFANVIEDHGQGITHVFRGKEHEHNTAIQSALYDTLGWKQPVSVNFGMLKLPEGKMHKRDMRAKLGAGKLSGWDDPSLPTIRALLRRGYKPEALRMAPFHAGLSKTDIEFNMESLNADNRKLADPTANRYMAVFSPMKLEIGNLHTDRVMMPVHPDYPDKGERTVPVNPKTVYLSEDDFRQFNGKVVRLKGLCNIKVAPSARFIDNEPRKELQKLHWVSEPNVKVTLVKPDGKEEGLGEPSLEKASVGDIIQLERVGFCRVDSVAKGKVTLFFAHK